ncbi:MAG: creatininase family protein [Burkholderiales bacterium]
MRARLGFCALLAWAAASHAAAASVYLEELTWTELRDAQNAGKTTVIIPVGGTEQSGPQLTLGKHNVRVKLLAGRIAEALGNAVVAPVVAYVPEGNITPPSAHMRFTGTISIPDATFKSLLDASARSFKQHGFTDVVLIGDHGGYQSLLKAVAVKLNQDWAGTKARAHFIDEYYRVTQTAYVKLLQAKGLSDSQIGVHAGAADTALQMAADPAGVRPDQFALAAREGQALGVTGDPRSASATLGQAGLELIVTHTVAAIRLALAPRH